MAKTNAFLILLLFIVLCSPTVFAGSHLTIEHQPPDEFYANDAEGQVFRSLIESTGAETARDVQIELTIPSGFTLKEDTLTAKVKDNGETKDVAADDIDISIGEHGEHGDQTVTITFSGLNPHEPVPEEGNGGGGGEHGLAHRFVFAHATETMRVGQTAYFILQVQDEEGNPTTNHEGFINIVSITNGEDSWDQQVDLNADQSQIRFEWTQADSGTYTVTANAGGVASAEHTITVEPVTFDLNPGQILDMEYKLATDALLDAEGKELETKAYHEGPDDTPIAYSRQIALFPYFREGKLSVDLKPIDPAQASQYRGETITLEATVTNTGDGILFGTDVEVKWGGGFVDPVIIAEDTTLDIGETNIDTSERTITTNIPVLGAGEERKVTFTLLVEGRESFALRVEGKNDVPDLDVVQTLPFTFRPRRPNISITAPTSTVEISYNEKETVEIIINNSDDNNYGQARNFRLDASFSDRFAITDVDEAWVWNEQENRFTYNANNGHIPQGGQITLTFKLSKKVPSNETTQPVRIFSLIPSYQNDEDDEFTTPLTTFSFRQVHSPQLSLGFDFKTPDSTDGDDRRLFLD